MTLYIKDDQLMGTFEDIPFSDMESIPELDFDNQEGISNGYPHPSQTQVSRKQARWLQNQAPDEPPKD